MVYGIVQLINFAHGEIFMIGAFGALATWSVLSERHAGHSWVAAAHDASARSSPRWPSPCSWNGSPTGRCATRPRLAPLITAIGVSVFLQEAVRLFYPGAKSAAAVPADRVSPDRRCRSAG